MLNIRYLVVPFASVLCLQNAFAAPASGVVPTPVTATVSASDPRIRHYVYNENAVYRLELYLKSVTALQFASGEEVQAILIGDSASWEVVKLKSGNVVSVKPIVEAGDTNMTIYTDKRVYSFDLHSAGAAKAGAPNVFRSVFTYPADKKRTPTAPAPDAAPINTDYMVAGAAAFRPAWVQDNGRQTTFYLPKNSPRPAIFKVGADRKEELINSRTNGDQVIVDGTSNYWVLRIGNEVVCVGLGSAVQASGGGKVKSEARNAI